MAMSSNNVRKIENRLVASAVCYGRVLKSQKMLNMSRYVGSTISITKEKP
jgi:hypothetical protein